MKISDKQNGADCKEIRPILKAIDPLFDISFDYTRETYSVYFNGYLFRTVPWKALDRKVIEDIKKTYWVNVNGDPFSDIERHNEHLDKKKEEYRSDLARELAKDIRKPILNEF